MGLKSALGKILSSGARVKNLAYDYEIFDSVRLSRPTISVGNLTFGGTGKTPVVSWILDLIEAKGLKATVISRNYKARTREPILVNPQEEQGAYLFGDEPFLLAKRHPLSQVAVGPRKSEVGQWIEENLIDQPDFFVIDDGFQHRSLHRDLDILLVDVSRDQNEIEPFPSGRGRESPSGFRRADLIFFTKCNLSTSEQIESYRQQFKSEIPIYELDFYFSVQFCQAAESSGDWPKEFLGVCGIAQPESFRSSLKSLGLTLAELMVFPDHHQYSASNVEAIRKRALELGLPIVTTEKDLVKLQAQDLPVQYYVKVEVRPRTFPKELHEFLDQIG